MACETGDLLIPFVAVALVIVSLLLWG